MSAFTDLLANPAAQRRYLAVLEPYDIDAEATVTLYYSEFGFTSAPSDTPDNTEYAARLDVALQFEWSLFQSGRLSGRTFPGLGKLRLKNPDRALDGLSAYAWSGRRVRVYLGGADFPLSDYGLIFDGEADKLQYDDQAIDVLLTDKQHVLDAELQTAVFAGSGNAEGGDDVAGKLKPFTLGCARNVPVVYLGVSSGGLHQFATSNGGPIVGVLAVRDQGVLLTFVASSPVAGQYTLDPATGVITLGGGFVGPITADVIGDRYLSVTSTSSISLSIASKTLTVSSGLALCAGMKVRVARTSAIASTYGDGVITSYSGPSLVINLTSISAASGPFTDWTIMPWGTTAGLVKRIAAIKGLSSFDTASFTALDLAQPATVGLWMPDGGNALAILDQIVNGAGCFYTFTRVGDFRVGRLSVPAGGGATYTSTHIHAITRLATEEPAFKVEVKHRRNYAPAQQLAGEVSDADRAFLIAEWRTEFAVDTDVQTAYPRSPPIVVEGLFDEQADAAAEVTRLAAMFGVSRDFFQATLKTQLFATDLNGQIEIDFDLGPLDGGKDMVVVTLREDAAQNQIVGEFWG